MTRGRLDKIMVDRGLVATRSQAESYIKLGKVKVAGRTVSKPGYLVDESLEVDLLIDESERYVSRAALKLASVVKTWKVNFADQRVLDIGSSTGGFSEFALKHGAAKVIAVDVGTDQMHPSLRQNSKLELHEKTDIRDFKMVEKPDLIMIDVSFISLRQVLPKVKALSTTNTQIIALLKPQFEAGKDQTNRGVIKNDKLRRQIIKDFESYLKTNFLIVDKMDSAVAGSHGNQERFYWLKVLA